MLAFELSYSMIKQLKTLGAIGQSRRFLIRRASETKSFMISLVLMLCFRNAICFNCKASILSTRLKSFGMSTSTGNWLLYMQTLKILFTYLTVRYSLTGGYDKSDKINELSFFFSETLLTRFPHGFSPYYTNPSKLTRNDQTTSILYIENVKQPQLPMLNLDYHSNIDIINTVLNTPAYTCPHGKDVLTLISGHNSGKTRICEELKLKINSNTNVNNILAITITFSNNWPMDFYDLYHYCSTLHYEADNDSNTMAINMVYSVIARITSMLYGCDIETAHFIPKRRGDLATFFPKVDLNITDIHLVLIAYIKAATETMRIQTGRDIDSIVLFIDDAHYPTDHIYDTRTPEYEYDWYGIMF